MQAKKCFSALEILFEKNVKIISCRFPGFSNGRCFHFICLNLGGIQAYPNFRKKSTIKSIKQKIKDLEAYSAKQPLIASHKSQADKCKYINKSHHKPPMPGIMTK